MRAEAPPCGGSQHSLRGLRHENNSHTAIKTDNCLRIAKPPKTSCQTTTRKQLFLINPPAPLRRQRTAESTQTTLTKSRDPCHSGCEIAGSKDKIKNNQYEKFIRTTAKRRGAEAPDASSEWTAPTESAKTRAPERNPRKTEAMTGPTCWRRRSGRPSNRRTPT